MNGKYPPAPDNWREIKSCRTCDYIHLKLRWSYENHEIDFWCQNTPEFEPPHWGIKELPDELICEEWKSGRYWKEKNNVIL